MAIDTRAKRSSMVAIGDYDFYNPVPDATNLDDAEDRAGANFLYFGIAPSAPAAPSTSPFIVHRLAFYSRRGRR